jgi:hypothetical protein
MPLALATSSAWAQSSPSPTVAARQAAFAELKATAKSGPALNANALGSVGADMVYTPVTPCRIVDTRNAGGAFAGGNLRTYDLDGTGSVSAISYAQQGGIAATCNIPHGVVYAAALNLTVTGSVVPGYLTAWGLGTQPNASVLNWSGGDTLANTTIVPITPGTGSDFSIYASSATHVIIDVVGYFAAPAATLPDVQLVLANLTGVPSGGTSHVSLACPAGYVVVGGSVSDISTFSSAGITSRGEYLFNTGWSQSVTNMSGTTRDFQVQVQCLRVPGR